MRLLLLLLLATVIGGCSCRIPVSASGSLEHGITFAFPAAKAVYYAGVTMRDASRQWQEVWRIEGKDRVPHIRYGEGTRGLSIKIAAAGLQSGRLYIFQVEARDGWGTPCVGAFEFVIMADGSVQECHQGHECRQGIL
jgi:hypothetical protein